MSADILSLPRRPAAAEPAVNQLENFWSSIRHGALVPSRADVDPARLRGLLKHAFIAEHASSGDMRIRVGGRLLRTLLGVDPHGVPLSTMLDRRGRSLLAREADHVFTDPATLRIGLQRIDGDRQVEGEMLLMPLRDQCGMVTLALGALAMEPPAHEGLHTLSVTSLLSRRLGVPCPMERQPRPTADVLSFVPQPA